MTIKQAVASGVSPAPQRAAIEFLVMESRRIALAGIYQKVRRRALQPDLFGLSPEDLALDSIAEVYQRDEEGRFPQLVGYFEAMSWQKLDEASLYIAFRRLILSKLNEGLFRRYKEADASLSKLIRNIKNAAKNIPGLRLVRLRELCLVFAGEDEAELNNLPLAPPEILEAYITRCLHDCNGLPEAVAVLAAFLEDNPGYRNGYPLSGFAQILRSAYVRLGEVDLKEREEVLLTVDVKQALEIATNELSAEMHSSYVGRGKVEPGVYATYFLAIRDILAAQSLNDASPVNSYFEALRVYLPALDRYEYTRRHRNVLEYLTTLCRARMHSRLQETSGPRHVTV